MRSDLSTPALTTMICSCGFRHQFSQGEKKGQRDDWLMIHDSVGKATVRWWSKCWLIATAMVIITIKKKLHPFVSTWHKLQVKKTQTKLSRGHTVRAEQPGGASTGWRIDFLFQITRISQMRSYLFVEWSW